MTTALHTWESTPKRTWSGDMVNSPCRRLTKTPLDIRIGRTLLLLSAVAVLTCISVTANSQSMSASEGYSGTTTTKVSAPMEATYLRPTDGTKFNNYLFDAYGPYPIAGAALAAGINQLSNAPPEWRQGSEGFGKRFGSDFAIAAVGTTTRFGLAEAFKEDTLYYRCECSGVWPRMNHAVTSTFTARHGEDGHRVFSLPAVLAPYAGSMTAVYGWYPDRYGVKDAFRMGNYSLLANIGGNIALEFFHSGRHPLLARIHLRNAHDSPTQEPSQ